MAKLKSATKQAKPHKPPAMQIKWCWWSGFPGRWGRIWWGVEQPPLGQLYDETRGSGYIRCRIDPVARLYK